MKKKWFTIIGLSVALAVISPAAVFADTAASATVTMEPCGAYLFEWRPVDCGNGRAFAILVGGNTLTESDVILKRGYDYNYTFNPNSAARPWGTVPDLVNYNGIWAVPDNERQIPDGIQPTLQITLLTNNKNMDTNERYIDVVHLPDGTDISSLPPEVRKYLINVDGSDAGAYDGTVTSGWFILKTFRENTPQELGGYRVVIAKDYQTQVFRNMETGEESGSPLPVSDVLHYTLEDGTWVCIRPSGTEPKLKFYIGVKADGLQAAQDKVDALDADIEAKVAEIA